MKNEGPAKQEASASKSEAPKDRRAESPEAQLEACAASLSEAWSAASETSHAVKETEAFIAKLGNKASEAMKAELAGLKMDQAFAQERLNKAQSEMNAIRAQQQGAVSNPETSLPPRNLGHVQQIPAHEAAAILRDVAARAGKEIPRRNLGEAQLISEEEMAIYRQAAKAKLQEKARATPESSLQQLKEQFEKFNETSLEAQQETINEKLKELNKNFSSENLQKIGDVLKKMESLRGELFAFARSEGISLQKPKVQENIRRSITEAERQITGIINRAREAVRLDALHVRSSNFNENLRGSMKEIGERGLVGEQELRGMMQLDASSSAGEQQSLQNFLRRFQTSFGGGSNLWDKVTDSGIAFLEQQQKTFQKFPSLASEFQKNLETVRSSKKRRDQRLQSDPKSTWS
jgi:hypothetical protein